MKEKVTAVLESLAETSGAFPFLCKDIIEMPMTEYGPEINKITWGSQQNGYCMYLIMHLITHQPYIGRAVHLHNRFETYQRKIDEEEGSQPIIKSIMSDGWPMHRLYVLAKDIPNNKELVGTIEQELQDAFDSIENGFNAIRASKPRDPYYKFDEGLGLHFTLEDWRATVRERRALNYQISKKTNVNLIRMYIKQHALSLLKPLLSRQKFDYMKKVLAVAKPLEEV